MNIVKQIFQKIDVLYDDKKWGKRISPDEWNANFKVVEDGHNELVEKLSQQINDIEETFTEVTDDGGSYVKLIYSGGKSTLQEVVDLMVNDVKNRFTKKETESKIVDYVGLLVKDVEYDSNTGVFRFVKYNGDVVEYDTVLEKVPVSMRISYDEHGDAYLIVTNDDGSETSCNVSKLIADTYINGSNQIGVDFYVVRDREKHFTLRIKDNSIGLQQLSTELVTKFDSIDEAKEICVSAKNVVIEARDVVVSAKTEVLNNANIAKTSANSAIEAKNACLDAKQTVEGYIESAVNAAESALASQNNASNSASQASVSASNALDSATKAVSTYNKVSNIKTEIDETANTVSNLAETVQTNADGAESACNDARRYASEALASRNESVSASEIAVAAKEAAESARDQAESIVGGDYASTEYVDQKVSNLKEYVDNNIGGGTGTGGLIDSVSVDGVTLPIDENKNVNIDLSGKVNAVAGKGLSTNDYTNQDKNKLSSIPDVTSGDAGKVLKVSTDGSWVLSAPSGFSASDDGNGNLVLNFGG